MSQPGKARALLATLRIANAPSVVSNVFLGYMVGWAFWVGGWNPRDTEVISWTDLVSLCVAGLFLYFAGNLANDWFDRKWDAKLRPERALPSGLFHPGLYLASAVLLAVAGVALAFRVRLACGFCAVVIVFLIVIYTWFHKRATWSVIPMGLCRAGLYMLGFVFWWIGWQELDASNIKALPTIATALTIGICISSGLLSYIAGLSLSARYEGMGDPPQGPRVVSLALLIYPVIAMPCFWMSLWPLAGVIGVIPFVVWIWLCRTRYLRPIPRYVSALLAGIPLVDFMAAAPLALVFEFTPKQGVADFPLFWPVILVPLVAFVLGRTLQKLAPAT